MNIQPIIYERIRNIRDCTFGWIDHNLLHNGFLWQLSSESLLLYFFLCLVADRHGLSYYDYEKICTLLKLEVSEYVKARNELVNTSLIAFKDSVFQVLKMPDRIKPQQKRMYFKEHSREGSILSLKQIFDQSLLK